MAWQQVTLRIPADACPRAEALLQLAGASSIAIADDGEAPILEPAPGTVPLWPRIRVSALFDATADLSALSHLLGSLGDGEITLERLDDALITGGTPESIAELEIGPRLKIVPAEFLEQSGPTALGLHMGLAFGTGRHATTALCLEWLEREMAPGMHVLDYGAGSGILALAALKLGAAHVTAVDIEPQALVATQRNAELNRLESRISVGTPEIATDQSFGLILANILARPLVELADSFARLQPPGATIVLSGALESQLDELASGYRKHYGNFERSERAGWGRLTGVRRSGYDR